MRERTTLPCSGSRLFALACGLAVAGCTSQAAVGPLSSSAERPEKTAASEQNSSLPRKSATTIAPQRGRDDKTTAASLATQVVFVDVACERGLTYVWPDQPRPMTALEAFGAGCAAFDCDNDDWQDVLLVADPHPRLYRNTGGGHFEDVTGESGLAAVSGDWKGCAIGDYNGDGRLDVLFTGYHQLALYKNLGGMHFEEATAEAGLDPLNNQNWGSSAGFMDLDGDGWLDLVVLNYVIFGPDTPHYCEFVPGIKSGCAPSKYVSERGRVFRNNGAGGFEPVPDAQGMSDTHGTALVLAFIDVDGDGRMDFYIGNDGTPADLLLNEGNMRFKNIAFGAGVSLSENARTISAMTADWGDFDRDGFLDLFVTNWQGASSIIFRGLGQNLFQDCSRRTGISPITKNRMGFGGKWIDLENDGWPDLFVVNGHVYDNVSQIQPDVPYRQPILLLSNQNARKFVDIVPALAPEIQRTLVGRGSATADFDNDGRVDLLAVDFEGPVMLLENRTPTKNHWLQLDLRGTAPNVFAYGARVVGKTANRIWIAEVSPASSYLSSSDPRIHWGLGEFSRLETLTIRWPDGGETTMQDVAADQTLRVVE
jgi:hypothetical protein